MCQTNHFIFTVCSHRDTQIKVCAARRVGLCSAGKSNDAIRHHRAVLKAGWCHWCKKHLKGAVAHGHHRKLEPRNPHIVRNYWAVKSWAGTDKPIEAEEILPSELDTEAQLTYRHQDLGLLQVEEHQEPYERESDARSSWWRHVQPKKPEAPSMHSKHNAALLEYQQSCFKGTAYESNCEKRALLRTIRQLNPNGVVFLNRPDMSPAYDTWAIMTMIDRALVFTVDQWANRPQPLGKVYQAGDQLEDLLIDTSIPETKETPKDFESMGIPLAPAPPLPRQSTLPNVLDALRTTTDRAAEGLRRNQTWAGRAEDEGESSKSLVSPSRESMAPLTSGETSVLYEAMMDADEVSQEWERERGEGARLLYPPGPSGCPLHGWGYEARCDDCCLGELGARVISLQLE